MILQVCPHTRPVRAHVYAMRFQLLGGANAGKLKQLNRIDGTARQDDFAGRVHLMQLACAFILHPNGARAVKQDAGGKRLFYDFQIGPFAGVI